MPRHASSSIVNKLRGKAWRSSCAGHYVKQGRSSLGGRYDIRLRGLPLPKVVRTLSARVLVDTGEGSSGFAAFVGDWAVFEGDVEEKDLHDEHYHGLDEEGDVVFGTREVEDAGRVLVGGQIVCDHLNK